MTNLKNTKAEKYKLLVRKRKIKLVIVSANQLYANGALNRLVNNYLISISDNKEFEVKLLAEECKGFIYRTLKKNVIILNYYTRPGRLRNISICVNIFLRLLFSKPPDIIHLHQLGIEILPLLIYCKIFKSKLVITNHFSSFKGQYRGEYYEYLVQYDVITKLLFINSNNYLNQYKNVTFICLSKEIVKDLQDVGFPTLNYAHIPNGIEITNEESIKQNNGDISIIWVGRYDAAKNLNLLFRVASILKKKNIEFTINVFGVNEKELDSQDMTLYETVLDFVFLKGFSDDLLYEIRKSNLGLVTSLSEAMSISMLEMLSCGLPIITTPVSGMKEVIGENYCGKICNSNEAEEIAEEIMKLMGNKEEYEKMSSNAINTIKTKYTIENSINKHLELYRKLIGNKITICAE